MTDGKELLPFPISWGKALIEAKDIDPIYDMLVGGFWGKDGSSDDLFLLDPEGLARWLIAYWCFYHAGVASHITEFANDVSRKRSQQNEAFWVEMEVAAMNLSKSPLGDRWPRSPERRHFRGQKCVDAVRKLASHYPEPEGLVRGIVQGRTDAAQIVKEVCELPQFGPWIAFKVADMMERVWGSPITFSHDIAMYDSPKKGLEEAGGGLQDFLDAYLYLSPPGLQNRGCGIQEVETVLCKWHSARGGHYFIGKDLKEIAHGLKGWGTLADRLARMLPTRGQP